MDEPSGVKPASSKRIENEEEQEKAMSAIRERVMKDNGWNTLWACPPPDQISQNLSPSFHFHNA